MSALQLGPLALPLPPLVVAAAAALGLALGKRLGRAAGVDPEPALWRLLLLGLLAARLGFVWTWRAAYFAEPWTILDIRDGGWEPVAGFAAACLYGLVLVKRQPLLRRPIVAATLLTLFSWTLGAVAVKVLSVGSAQPLPAISLQALDGRQLALSSFLGKPTVVNLWATWCPPCRREMPLLQQAQAAHPEVHFVFANQGETQAVVERYLRADGLVMHNVLLDPRKATGAAFDASALPTTLFFDAQGRLVSLRVGALSQATLAQQLRTIQQAAPR